jgi:nucleoid-associated protein YgaU
MDEATAKRDQLKMEITDLDKAIAQLKMRDAQLAEEIRKGNEELTALIGESQRKDFEARLNSIETKLNQLEQLTEQTLPDHEGEVSGVQSSIAEARAHKLAQLQEYKDRIDAQQRRLAQMQSLIAQLKTESSEVVVGTWAEDRACLWNIAKKQAVYGNPALWVKLWQGNKSQISNPDVIHPGQKLQVPTKAPLTAEELSARDEYYSTRPSGSSVFAQGDEEP